MAEARLLSRAMGTAHPTDLNEEPIWILRLRVLHDLRAARDRVRTAPQPTVADHQRLAELAEEARSIGLHEAARSAESRA